MKKEKSRGSAKRLIIILSLTLALIIALGAFSFAWIRNYVAVDSLGIQTGKLLYDIKVYDGNVISDPGKGKRAQSYNKRKGQGKYYY